MFELWWNGECVDSVDTMFEAEYLRGEYELAYRAEVTIRSNAAEVSTHEN